MMQRFKKGLLIWVAGFFAVWAIKFLLNVLGVQEGQALLGGFMPSFQMGTLHEEPDLFKLGAVSSSRNYARDSVTVYYGYEGTEERKEQVLETKLEKMGMVSAKSRHFDSDEEALRASLNRHKAIIQNEEKTGLRGTRQLSLRLGVVPGSFDALVAEVRKIGVLINFRVEQVDRTKDYRQLLAERKALEKALKSLMALKTRSGKVEEFIKLEDRILELEKQTETFSSQISHFEEGVDLYTLNLSLSEYLLGGFIWRSFSSAFTWSLGWYAVYTFVFFVAALGVLIIVQVMQKIRVLPETWAEADKIRTRRHRKTSR